MLESIKCNFCNKDQAKLLFKVKENITCFHEEFCVVKCKNCGLVYTNPRPGKRDISKYYPSDSYYSYKKNNVKTLKERIRNIYLEEVGRYPGNGKENFLAKWLKKFIVTFVKGNISVIVPYIDKGKILDIGCGRGSLLQWLKNHKWETYGVEINKHAAEDGNREELNIFNGELTDANYLSDFFDIVVINQVLEHVYDPQETLREIYRILKPTGLLIVGVPNIDSYEAKIFQKYWFALQIPTHLYHFSADSLKLMLLENKFRIKKIINKVFIPLYNKYSLSLLIMEKKYLRAFYSCVMIFLKPFLLFFSKEKNKFGQNITIYAEK